MAERTPTRDEIVHALDQYRRAGLRHETASTGNLAVLRHTHQTLGPREIGDMVWTFPDPKDGTIVRTGAVKFKGEDPTKAQLDDVTGVPVVRDDGRLLLKDGDEYYDLCTGALTK